MRSSVREASGSLVLRSVAVAGSTRRIDDANVPVDSLSVTGERDEIEYAEFREVRARRPGTPSGLRIAGLLWAGSLCVCVAGNSVGIFALELPGMALASVLVVVGALPLAAFGALLASLFRGDVPRDVAPPAPPPPVSAPAHLDDAGSAYRAAH